MKSRKTTLCVIATIVAGILAAWPSDAVAQTEPLNCDDWNTLEFFEGATADDVTACLATGADVHARDDYGFTALHRAAGVNASPAVLEALLDAGADRQAQADNDAITPLHAAAFNAEPRMIEFLLRSGGNPETLDARGQTVLHYAARYNGNPDVINVLLDAGADPNATGENDLAPLHDAARYNANEAVVEALIDGDANVGSRTATDRAEEGSYTPLHFAAEFNENVAVTQVLIDAGADVNARETRQRFPLFLALGNDNYLDVMEALLRAGADPTLAARRRDEFRDSSGRLVRVTMSSSHTALHRAASFRSDRVPAIEALIDTGVDVDLQSLNGITPLMLVASLPHAELLLEMGADVRRRRNQLGGTALHYGGRWNHLNETESVELIGLLVNNGAEVNSRTEDGETPLHHAAASGAPDIIAALVAQGADVNARDVEGNTALHLAASCGNCELAGDAIVTLLDAGADAGLRNAQGLTPWDVARENEENDELSQTEGYWRLNEARFDAPSQ